MTCVCTLTDHNSYLTRGMEVARDLKDLYLAVTNKSLREIVFTNDYADEYFTPTTLNEFMLSAKKMNPLLNFKVQTSWIEPHEYRIPEIMRMSTREEFINFAAKDRYALDIVQTALQDNLNAKEEILNANAKMSTMSLELTKARAEIEELKSQLERTNEVASLAEMRLKTLTARIRNSYDIDLTEDKMFGIRVPKKAFQKILYIKEITRVKFTDTLVYYLQEIIRTKYDYPVRLVVLESLESAHKTYLYPTCKSHRELSAEDVWLSDIFMAGFQQQLMTDICSNVSNQPYMIVLDRTGFKNPYLYGDDIVYIWTASDPKDVPSNIPHTNIISYNKQTLHIKNIPGFDKMDPREKIQVYSDLPITLDLIKAMEM